MTATASETGTTVALSISGMTCEGCASTITDTLVALPGVTSAVVNHAKGHAVVQLAAGTDAEGFAYDADAAIHDAGYTLDGAQAMATLEIVEASESGGGCGGDCACGAGEATTDAAPKDEAGCCGGGGGCC